MNTRAIALVTEAINLLEAVLEGKVPDIRRVNRAYWLLIKLRNQLKG